MYVFVREDITPPAQAVQSCHACIEATSAFSLEKLQDHPSVIILAAKNEQKLHQIRRYLVENDVQHVHFYDNASVLGLANDETDFSDQLTALATQPIAGDKRRLFRKFQLLRAKGGA